MHSTDKGALKCEVDIARVPMHCRECHVTFIACSIADADATCLRQGCQYGQGKSIELHFQHGMSTLAISFQHGGYMAWRRAEINFQRTVNMACVQKRSGV